MAHPSQYVQKKILNKDELKETRFHEGKIVKQFENIFQQKLPKLCLVCMRG